MSISDSDTSWLGSEFKNFRQITRDRLLYEMVRSTNSGNSKSSWKVLIMDKVTVRIMSCACKMADITEEGVSLVEQIHKRRQPLPSMDSIYFIQPTGENIDVLLSDMSGQSPLYRKAFVFFSSPVALELVSRVKRDGVVLSRIGAFREMNLEYFAVDSQGFVTDNNSALEELFGDENPRKGDACLNMMATRIATVFASLQEFPFVHYRAANCLDPNTMTTFRDLIPTKLAASVWNSLMKYKTSLPNFPQSETCDLLILDRSIDQIAPVIHEWTYDAMCHDLLTMEGNKYVYEVLSKAGGKPEKKEVILEDSDPIWLEIRHTHIADASERLHQKMQDFVSKNRAAQIHGSGYSGEVSTRDLKKMVESLPQYSDQMEKLSVHVDIAGKINRIIRDTELKDVGQLEQDLIFGDARTKDLVNFLRVKKDISRENKLRILMIYAAAYPEKFANDKILKLMELAELPPDDMTAVYNMRFLETASNAKNITKKTSNKPFSLKLELHKKKKKKHAARQDRPGEEAMWQLSRFYPLMEELIEKLSKGELPKNDYPCMNDPSASIHSTPRVASARFDLSPAPHSMRSRRTASWARSRNSDDGYLSDSILRSVSLSSDYRKMGQRIFVFIVGGATRSEQRVCHKLSTKLNREIILGSSSIDDPPHFITKIKLLSANELSIDDIEI